MQQTVACFACTLLVFVSQSPERSCPSGPKEHYSRAGFSSSRMPPPLTGGGHRHGLLGVPWQWPRWSSGALASRGQCGHVREAAPSLLALAPACSRSRFLQSHRICDFQHRMAKRHRQPSESSGSYGAKLCMQLLMGCVIALERSRLHRGRRLRFVLETRSQAIHESCACACRLPWGECVLRPRDDTRSCATLRATHVSPKTSCLHEQLSPFSQPGGLPSLARLRRLRACETSASTLILLLGLRRYGPISLLVSFRRLSWSRIVWHSLALC